MLSLPGARWKQHNNNVEERKIREDFTQQDVALSFWKPLAAELKGHPAIVGYNIHNEPSPEFIKPRLQDWYTENYPDWYKKVQGTPADLNLFYRKAVKAIREVDSETPIVLDSGFFGETWAFKILEPVADDKILYSFHLYEPYTYNSQFNKGRFTYPGKAPVGELDDAPVLLWNKKQLADFLVLVIDWQKRYGIPSNRIFVGETGVCRTNEGALTYLKDVIDLFNAQQWHWAFYLFREDTWDRMDYELGTEKPGELYWQAIEKSKYLGQMFTNPIRFQIF